jgi:RNA polymerase sigma-70 factor (ECF subfamily)
VGFYYLQQASKWEITSNYYIEASIAYWHTVENSNPDKWTSILKLYDVLLLSNKSSSVVLNRILAFSKVYGSTEAINEVEKSDVIKNHFYFILLAELYRQIDPKSTIAYLAQALQLCKTVSEKEIINKRIEEVEQKLIK